MIAAFRARDRLAPSWFGHDQLEPPCAGRAGRLQQHGHEIAARLGAGPEPAEEFEERSLASLFDALCAADQAQVAPDLLDVRVAEAGDRVQIAGPQRSGQAQIGIPHSGNHRSSSGSTGSSAPI